MRKKNAVSKRRKKKVEKRQKLLRLRVEGKKKKKLTLSAFFRVSPKCDPQRNSANVP